MLSVTVRKQQKYEEHELTSVFEIWQPLIRIYFLHDMDQISSQLIA